MIGYEISIDFYPKKVQSFSVKTPKSNKNTLVLYHIQKNYKDFVAKKRSRHIKYVSAPKINF